MQCNLRRTDTCIAEIMITFIVIKNTETYDLSNLVESVRWSGRRTAGARSLTVNFIDDDGYGHERHGIDILKGQHCIFYWNGEELFRGMFMKQSHSSKKESGVVAYDNGIHLKSKDTFTYSDKKASDIFVDCCKRFGIPYDNVVDTVYRIPEFVKPTASALDVIQDALSQTYKATGIRFYFYSKDGKLRLIERRKNIQQWVLETGTNIIDYNSSVSIENILTRYKLYSKEGSVLAEATDIELEKHIGIFQDVKKQTEALNIAQLTELVRTALNEKNKAEETLNVNILGIPSAITGGCIYLMIKELNLSRSFYIEEDVHIFEGNSHTTQLSLTADTFAIQSDKSAYNPGDIVQFKGGFHYSNAMSTEPVGGERTAGKAKCTDVSPNSLHPFHLIGGAFNEVEGNSNVYGWVNADLII